MKRILLAILFSPVFSLALQAQIFVNQDATGTADGSSWDNAYTDLQTALDNANAGDEVWLAAGTYFAPLDTVLYDTYGGFSIMVEGLSIYGGFQGTESMLTERDPVAAPTILSADLSNDDLLDDFDNNRSDNATRVLYIDSLLSQATILDGLTFEGGTGVSDTDLPYDWRSGGGIFTYSPVQISNCIFQENFSGSGASINLFRVGTAGSSIRNTIFRHNKALDADGQAAAILMVTTADIIVEGCDFMDNLSTRGTVYTLRCRNVDFTNCNFERNIDIEGFGGGAAWNWNSVDVTYSNCVFRENEGGNGGAIYNDGRETSEVTITFDGCLFEDNTATSWGAGAVYNWQSYYIVNNCRLVNNTATNTAGAIYTSGASARHEIRNSIFENNSAFGGWGGSMASYTDVVGLVENCSFKENTASTSGGAITLGFRANVSIKQCEFEGNTANFGGAIYAQNDTTTIDIDSSLFSLNSSSNFGGGIVISGGIDLTIDNSEFNENSSDIGGAISAFIDTLIRPELDIQNTIFKFNVAGGQGGALNLFNTDAFVNNCLFETNLADGNGIGGAISNNGFDGYHSELTVVNSTFGGNIGIIGGGIAQFVAEGDSATLTIQNTILGNNLGDNYANETGDAGASVISLGGNISSDESMMDLLTHEKDQNATDPMFVDEFDDFRLMEGSPAINAGVESEYVLDHDLVGNPRIGTIDAGAYEFQMITSTEEVEQETGLALYPNPVKGRTLLEISNDMQGAIQLHLFAMDGKQVHHQTINKQHETETVTLQLSSLPAGTYQLVISQGIQQVRAGLVKL